MILKIILAIIIIYIIWYLYNTTSSTTPAIPATKPVGSPPIQRIQPSHTTDPASLCPEYKLTDVGVSNECLWKIWGNYGCTTGKTMIPDNYDGWWGRQSLQNVIKDMDIYANGFSTEPALCYGSDRSKYPTR